MAGIKIEEVKLHRIIVPLKRPFSTHLQTVDQRESILIEMIGANGVTGLGECVAFSSPWYTEETVQTCWDALINWLIPTVIGKRFQHPSDLSTLFAPIKGNRMAKASLDQAAWDLYAKQSKKPLWRLIGGLNNRVDAGIVLTGAVDEEMVAAVKEAEKTGYKRVKLKIDEEMNPQDLKEFTAAFKEMLFFADANGLFERLGMQALSTFDDAGLTLIEQPFGEDNWSAHVEAANLMKTPIALDESIRSVRDAEQMIAMGAGSIIVLKPGRVGGLTESLKVCQLAADNGIPIWIGGMIEFGISKAHNLALASLAPFTLPGDFSASTHFWYEEPVAPEIIVTNGHINLTENVGINVHLNKAILEKYTIQFYETKNSSL